MSGTGKRAGSNPGGKDDHMDASVTKLRSGYTTGSCAAAAAKAALIMMETGEDIYNVSIVTPKGIIYNAEIVDIKKSEDNSEVTCAVIKDGGDDPDVTTGAYVYVTLRKSDKEGIRIDGGEGVGRVTKPGLDQPIGEAAINSVPRRMIKENLEQVLLTGKSDIKGLDVIVSVPGGEEIAQKTFNPMLGIVGGISILGTTGIVEPMSDSAIVETIRTHVRVKKAEGKEILLAAPGNYGITFLSERYKLEDGNAVMTSNFVYDAVRIALEEGFSKMLFVGHIGKLVKVAGGIKNTHSRYGDHRMEILSDIANDDGIRSELSECVMTDEAVRIITEKGLADKVFPKMAELIKKHMEEWADGKIQIEIIVFSNEYTELVSTAGAHGFMEQL
ncbi:cobalt-precorrin-5B (C(1))-methyltransferase CbiD [Butyrivibrio sp. INlla21]|uniref:cobalt-precorrin-5B (C(1))-methyltransferase CbiD n=1 Tax=Butyrivibrio sp. INlla21 TaxID=1520811 RepID=UPI0008DF3353|nr:cobalt-precorrin-5B (C(1))-methyltransferase CbiD [Butyrivibrio sp. INlla21]SFU34273.1 cobalt-precorrin-5B (C1)-methyltransferase [Butyrivibrio sp. INlla21]